jgi:pilus assembly protein Flp/PilA
MRRSTEQGSDGMVQYGYIKAWLHALAGTERGASLVEYALLVALIAVVCIGAISFLGGNASDTFSGAGSDLG